MHLLARGRCNLPRAALQVALTRKLVTTEQMCGSFNKMEHLRERGGIIRVATEFLSICNYLR